MLKAQRSVATPLLALGIHLAACNLSRSASRHNDRKPNDLSEESRDAGESDQDARFNITIRPRSANSDFASIARRAAERWEEIIVDDVPDAVLSSDSYCGGWVRAGKVDDVIVVATIGPLDGPSGVHGVGVPCAVRTEIPRVPVLASVSVDHEDFQNMSDDAREELVLHELAHALGFGTLWGDLNRAASLDAGADGIFLGEQAAEALRAISSDEGTAGVPVPTEPLSGFARGHWPESLFLAELMTPQLDGTLAPISVVTVASFADLGYGVRLGAADPFRFTE